MRALVDYPTSAPASRPSGPAKLARPVAVVAMVGIVAIMAWFIRQAAKPLYEPDLWWHLRAGEEYWGNWSLTNPEPLTPFATAPWFSRSWLPEMAFAKVEQWFGLPGIAWLYGAGLVALTIVVYVTTRRFGAPLAAGLVTMLALIGASGALTPRPQLLSFILLSLVTAAWLRATEDLRPPWWVIPATWVWAMSHGMWMAGVLLGAGVVLGLALDGRLDRTSGLRLAAVPAASVAVAALTPQGPRVLWAVIESRGMDAHISEYAPPALPDTLYVLVLALLATVVLTGLVRARRVPWAHLAIIAQATFWTLYSVRSISWGALMIAPLAAAALQEWLPGRPDDGIGRGELTTLAAAGLVGLVLLAVVAPRTATQPGGTPNGLNGNLQALEDSTPVLNQYALGGWIEWRHRHLAPVIDGNTNAYEFDHFVAYQDARLVKPGWQEFVINTGVTHALLEVDAPLAGALQDQLNWQVVDTDEGFALLEAPATP